VERAVPLANALGEHPKVFDALGDSEAGETAVILDTIATALAATSKSGQLKAALKSAVVIVFRGQHCGHR